MKKTWFRVISGLLVVLLCSTWAAAMPRMLVPGGSTMGIKLYSKGVVITGFEEQSAAQKAGLKKGDIILAVDGETIHTAQGLRGCLDDDELVLTVQRKGKETTIPVEPDKTAEGYKLGAYIRDSMAGIGTVTYCDPETGEFGALGHGVSDVDAGVLLPLEAGVAVASSVSEVKKGSIGAPGELKGAFDVRNILGAVGKNTEMGIFGKLKKPIAGKPLPAASSHEVHAGKAEILSNVQGIEVRSYSVEILKIYAKDNDSGKNMLIRVTDENLLRQTGGIVQGMSGSPIIQDGKLVGAVTHVLVNDPTRGYGIFIENMLDATG